MPHHGTAALAIAEMREFASFTPCEQRYIRRSLDVGLGRHDAVQLWARDLAETASIRAQYRIYEALPGLRAMCPRGDGTQKLDSLAGRLMGVAAFDLAQNRIESFSAFRFLYERLLGAWTRPWLPAAFCGAAALPQIAPDRRRSLLHSISEAAATAPGWSDREPRFFPEFIVEEAG